MDNCYVTTGKTIRKRPGLTLVANLETGTSGLMAAGGVLNTFYATGTVTHADTRFVANNIAHPTDATQEVKTMHFADVFNGYLYVSAEYYNGDIKHHYLDGTSPTHITDTNCPNSNAVVKKASKIFAVGEEVVRFCKTSNPRDYTTASDAGFLGVGIQQSGAIEPKCLGEYSGYLVVFFKDSAQIWTVDPDPAKMSFVQSVSVGCPYPHGAANMAGDVFFVSYDGIRSITTLTTTGNMIDVDVGSPIDSIIKSYLTPTTDVRSFYFRGAGQFWVMIGSTAFVYSFSRTSKVSAWSRYVFPIEISAVTELDAELYFRSGNTVYKFDDSVKSDAGILFDVNIEFPYLDFKTPGVMKQIMGMDTVMVGSADVQIKFDSRNPDFITPTTRMSEDTRPGEMTAVEVVSTGIAPVITNRDDKDFELHAMTFYYENLSSGS